MDIVHNYKGYEIKKYEHRYSCRNSWTETWYEIKGVSQRFDKLKEAKQYIDFLESKNDR